MMRPAHRELRCSPVPICKQPAVADQQQQKNAPDQMMDMAATHLHVVERPVAGADRVREHPHGGEGEIKADCGDEQAFPSGLTYVFVI
jgi:hypothetical protein